MLRTRGKRSRQQRRAAVVAQVAVCSTVMVGMVALVVDIGSMYTRQTELQVAADAAALAAAQELIGDGGGDPHELAIQAANTYAGLNVVGGGTPRVLPEDVEFGRASYDPDTGQFDFPSAYGNFDGVRVTVKRMLVPPEQPGGQDMWTLMEAPFLFGPILGRESTMLEARAAAVLLPRDIAVVIDLSNSMCYDSQIRYWNRTDGGYSNLRDVWCALDGPEPDKPYIPGPEPETEYADDTGPAIGTMSEWGDPLLPDSYDATTDPGLVYLPKGLDWSGDSAVEQLLIGQGYDEWERWAILTNETQGYLTAEKTDSEGFASRVIWQEDVGNDHDRVTVFLTSDADPHTPALSHLTISLPSCARATAASTASSQGGYVVEVVAPDPKTGYYGIKFDETALGEDGQQETEWFSFEVPSSCDLGDIDVACKAGRNFGAVNQSFVSADPTNTTRWRYRVAAVLGLAQWDSGMDGTGGDGDGMIEGSGELAWIEKYSPCWNWSWTEYIDHPRTFGIYNGASIGFKYRYGLKTFVDFMMAKRPSAHQTCDLWMTPEQPLRAVKDAVWTMTNVIESLDSLDQMSLEVFDSEGRHEVDLTEDIWGPANTLYERQTGHYAVYTNIGGGLYEAMRELTFAPDARQHAAKVIVLMSDGSPNRYDERNDLQYIDDLDPPASGESWSNPTEYAQAMARVAAENKMYIYTVSVGYGADRNLMAEIAQTGNGEHFYAAGNPQEYTAQLEQIFRTLGGRRPVALIE